MGVKDVLEHANIDYGSMIVGVDLVMEWNGFHVYEPVFTGHPRLGAPFYYLEKDGSVRVTEPDEGWYIFRELVRIFGPDE